MTDTEIIKLKRELKIDAKAIGIPSGSATIFIKRTINDAKKSLKTKKSPTEKDIKRAITKELKKYNKDLAYIYQNRDTII